MEQLKAIHLSFKCPKAFDELTPCAGGWYCNGCHKIVHDMRGKAEEDIKAMLAANDYKMCGLFEADRLGVSPALPGWRKWAAATVLALGFTGLHQTLMAQQLKQPDSVGVEAKKPTKPLNENEFFGVFEISPDYPGGLDKFYKYVMDSIKPDSSCIPGQKVIMTFVVGIDGALGDVKVLRGNVSPEMKAQLIGIFEKSKKWKPGAQNGRLVRQQFTCPITF